LAVGQEGKLPLSTFGYPYQQLVTILTKKTEAGIFKTFIAIALFLYKVFSSLRRKYVFPIVVGVLE
jgi:hypothetical protein